MQETKLFPASGEVLFSISNTYALFDRWGVNHLCWWYCDGTARGKKFIYDENTQISQEHVGLCTRTKLAVFYLLSA